MEQDARLSASLTEEERYRLLVESVTDYAIYMLDADGRLTSWLPSGGNSKLPRLLKSFRQEDLARAIVQVMR